MKRFMALIALAFLLCSTLLAAGSLNQVRADVDASPLDHSGCDGGFPPVLPQDCIIVVGSGLKVDSVTAQGQDKTKEGTYGQYRVYGYDINYNNKFLMANSSFTTIPGDRQKHGRTFAVNHTSPPSGGHVCAGFFWHYIPKNEWVPLHDSGQYPRGACAEIH